MKKALITLVILFTLISNQCLSQVAFNYNLINYIPRDYNASSQNWGIDKDSSNIYVANNDGLLIFNGNNWKLYRIPSKNYLRTVKVIKNVVYTAGEDNIGFWEKNDDGEWIYTSILPLLKQDDKRIAKSDTYWSIASDDKYIYFQSFSKILQYDGKALKVLDKSCHMLLHQANNQIYVHRLFKGLYTLKHSHFTKILDNADLKGEELKFFLALNDSTFILGMNRGDVFIKKAKDDLICLDQIKRVLFPYEVNCGRLLYGKYIVLGTIGGGLFIFDLQGNLIQHIAGKENLQSNGINQLELNDDDIWVTLDCGIAQVDLNPTVSLWKKTNEIGTITAACVADNVLHIGTNQGLYKYNNGDLQEINQYMGGVFCLKSIKNNLICGGSAGAFLKTGNHDWKKICETKGLYDLKYVAKNGYEYLVAPSFTFITYFSYRNGYWAPYSEVRDFLSPLMQLTPEDLHTLWAINSQEGIYRIKINTALNKLESIRNYGNVKGLTDYKHINIEEIDGHILFFSPEGVFKYDSETDRFIQNRKLSQALSMTLGSQWMTHTSDNEYWFAKDNELFIFQINENDARYVGSICLNEYGYTLLQHGTAVINVAPNRYLVSSVEGTLIVNKNNILNKHSNKEKIHLSYIKYNQNGIHYADVNGKTPIRIPFNVSDLEIAVSKTINSKSNLLRYKILSESEGSWSDWSKNGVISLHRLPAGKHMILIEDYFGNSLVLKIIVPQPFYRSSIAILCYILVIGFVVFYVTRRFQHIKRYRIIRGYEEEQRKKDDEIIRLNNERLKETIRSQQSEINEKLRSISQKQELLLNIGDELDRQKEELGERYPRKKYEKLRKIINEGMNSEKDFMLFQNYYQEVNRDFLLYLKEIHPDLTPGELKFCCLIRSNLSTKDIAAVLNITIRGVELKKYRLKRKLKLEEENIYDYILKLQK